MRGSCAGERGLVLTLVLVVFLFVEVIVAGGLALVMSDLHGAVAGQLAMHSLSAAEAGLNYAVAQLVERAAAPLPSDEEYAGEPEALLTGAGGRPVGAFSVAVACVYPRGLLPPGCLDDPGTAAVDERDLRVVRSIGFPSPRASGARRQVEATVRRYVPAPGDINVFGICGRTRVALGPGTTVMADVGSNGDVTVGGPSETSAVVGRLPAAPSLGPQAEAVAPDATPGLSGLYTWRVTFLNTRGQESGGSPPTATLALADQHGRLTHLPVGGPSIVRRRIYRTPEGSPEGPWFLVGEVAENDSREYTDGQPDETLRWRIPGTIAGSVTAGGGVSCVGECAIQIAGGVREGVREVVCPNFLAPPAQPGGKPAPDPIVQTATDQTMHWSALHVREDESLTIETLSTPDARLHLHLTDIILERGARVVITGSGIVYFHVQGTFTLAEEAVFGAVDFSGYLLSAPDRVHVLLSAQDTAGEDDASVVWQGHNKVAGLIFAPNANVVIDQAAAFRGGLYGQSIRISRSTGIVLDPTEGLGSEKSIVRPSPFQYILRWYDNPHPGVGR